MNPNSILNRVAGKSRNISVDTMPIFIRHILMKSYGWIPKEEYDHLPAQYIVDLLECIKYDAKIEKEMMDKAKRR